MTYTKEYFDFELDRRNTRSTKWDGCNEKFGVDPSVEMIPMWIADMDFRTAQPIIDAAKKKAEEGIWGYTSRPASYYEAVCGWQKRRNGWDVDPKMISFAVGVVPAMSSMVNVFTKPEDKVLIQTPVYSEFYDVTESWGRQVVESPLKEKDGVWSINWEDFEKKAGEAKMFFLCNPHNPLGIVWSREDLTRMCEICIRHQVLIVSDEIHSDLIFHGKKHIPTATLSEEIAAYVITCTSGTKTFNLAGIQAAAIVFPNQELKGVYDRFWVNLDIHRNNAFSSVIMETAFNEGEEWLEQLLEYISGNFDFIREYCREHIPQIKPNLPDATYLVWLDCRELGMSNEELKNFMIHKAGLGLNEGWSFGRSLSGYMRLNAACPRSVIEKALKQLEAAVAAL